MGDLLAIEILADFLLVPRRSLPVPSTEGLPDSSLALEMVSLGRAALLYEERFICTYMVDGFSCGDTCDTSMTVSL